MSQLPDTLRVRFTDRHIFLTRGGETVAIPRRCPPLALAEQIDIRMFEQPAISFRDVVLQADEAICGEPVLPVALGQEAICLVAPFVNGKS